MPHWYIHAFVYHSTGQLTELTSLDQGRGILDLTLLSAALESTEGGFWHGEERTYPPFAPTRELGTLHVTVRVGLDPRV